MTDLELTVTRRQLLRRAAAGGTILTLPGLLAACGGSTSSSKKSGGTGTSGGKKQLAKTLYFSNWPLYIDINEKTKTHPSLAQFTKRVERAVILPETREASPPDRFEDDVRPLVWRLNQV